MKNVHRLVQLRTLQTMFYGRPQMPSEVAWAWIVEQQSAGRLLNLARKRPGSRGPEKGWEEQTLARSGWARNSQVNSEGGMNLMRVAERVLKILQEKRTQQGWSEVEGGGTENEGVLLISAALVREAWQSLKSGFRGEGGKKAMWGAIGILMIQGRVEGDVGRSPMRRPARWLRRPPRNVPPERCVITIESARFFAFFSSALSASSR